MSLPPARSGRVWVLGWLDADVTWTSHRSGPRTEWGPCVSFPGNTCLQGSGKSEDDLFLVRRKSQQPISLCGGGPRRKGPERPPEGGGEGGRKKGGRDKEMREGETQREGGRPACPGVPAVAPGRQWQLGLEGTWQRPGVVAPIRANVPCGVAQRQWCPGFDLPA